MINAGQAHVATLDLTADRTAGDGFQDIPFIEN